MIREQEIPVELFYSERNMERLRRGVEDNEYWKAVLVEHELMEE